MILSIKRRIQNYLDSIAKEQWTPFEEMLEQYLNGALLDKLSQCGIGNLSCTVDFLDDYKCINVNGKYRSFYIDIEIEQKEFSIGCDPIEPDEHTYFLLTSSQDLYATVTKTIESLG